MGLRMFTVKAAQALHRASYVADARWVIDLVRLQSPKLFSSAFLSEDLSNVGGRVRRAPTKSQIERGLPVDKDGAVIPDERQVRIRDAITEYRATYVRSYKI